jgi:hypothetical protein
VHRAHSTRSAVECLFSKQLAQFLTSPLMTPQTNVPIRALSQLFVLSRSLASQVVWSYRSNWLSSSGAHLGIANQRHIPHVVQDLLHKRPCHESAGSGSSIAIPLACLTLALQWTSRSSSACLHCNFRRHRIQRNSARMPCLMHETWNI